jgi:hypothetical protein
MRVAAVSIRAVRDAVSRGVAAMSTGSVRASGKNTPIPKPRRAVELKARTDPGPAPGVRTIRLPTTASIAAPAIWLLRVPIRSAKTGTEKGWRPARCR